MQCTFEEETIYPDGSFRYAMCVNKAGILIINDPCYGLCYVCAYRKLKAKNEQLENTIIAKDLIIKRLNERLTDIGGQC